MRAELNMPSRRVITAGRGKPLVKLIAGAEPDTVLAAIGGAPFQNVDIAASLDTFCAAKDAPIFYGASADGRMLAIMFKLMSLQVYVLVQPIPGIRVNRVVAASKDETVLFVDNIGSVWLVNMKTPTAATAVGKVSSPKARLVAAFSAPSVAVVAVHHATKTLRLVVISISTRYQPTWGAPNKDALLDAPSWALCITCDMLYSTVTAHVAGTAVVQSQVEAVLAGPPKSRTSILMTARQTPVVSVATKDDALRCLLVNNRLVELTRRGRADLGTAKAMSPCGDVLK